MRPFRGTGDTLGGDHWRTMDAIALPDREIADRRDLGGANHDERAVAEEAARRRTFAVISHPDAGKSTLTEALALHARASARPAPSTARRGRRGDVSDWMEMEQDRGISITSAALQFAYDGTVDQPARHPRPRRLLRGHLPGARRGRRRRHARRRGQGHRAADLQALRGVPRAAACPSSPSSTSGTAPASSARAHGRDRRRASACTPCR